MKTKLLMISMVLSAILNFFGKNCTANSEVCCAVMVKDACCAKELIAEKLNKRNDNYSVMIPFGYSNRLITVKIGLDNAEDVHEFILDSGAPTFITDTVAQTHDMTLINSEAVYDVNQNQQKVDKYCLRKINVGGKEIKNISAVSSPMVDEMPLLKNRPYSGLLGANTMRNSIWMINYNCREISLIGNMDSLSIPKEAFSAKMKTDELNRPTVSLTMGDNQTLCFIIDVGYNGSLLIPKKYMSRPLFNDSLSFTQSETLSSGFAWEVKPLEYKFIKDVTIGEAKLENIKASTSGNNTEALIGNEFLENYIVVLDFINERVTFLPADKSCGNECC